MTGALRWITTVISLLHGALVMAQPIDLSVRVQNSGGDFLKATRMCGLAPRALNGVTYDWEITGSLPIQRVGQQYCVDLPGIGPHQSKQITLKWQTRAEMGKEKSPRRGHYDSLAQPSPELMRLAGSFARYSKAERVGRIFDWMQRHIAFSGIRRGVDGAEHALRTRQGDCTEHMLLAAELLERNWFTVRRVLGVALPHGRFRISADSLHNWVEYWDGRQWLIFDSSRGVLDKPDQQIYVALHFYEDSQQLGLAPLSADQLPLKLYLQ